MEIKNKDRAAYIAQQHLNELMDFHDQISNALVVTVDGHLFAENTGNNNDINRLASMGSSLMSLGDTITHDLLMGGCKNVIIENEKGYVVFMYINKSLVLISVCKAAHGLGILLSASRACAKELSDNLIKILS